MAGLPVIDFSLFLDERSTAVQKLCVAQEIDKACREVGFFYLKGHGLAPSVIEDMLNVAKSFFEDNTREEKDQLAIKPPGDGLGDDARGFSRIDGGEKGAHEALDVFRPVIGHSPPYDTGMGENFWPSKPPTFRPISETYIAAMLPLATQVIRAVAMALEVDENIFLSKTNKAFWNLRVVAYDATPGTAGMGQHTDFGILTFLMSNGVKDSFQVLAKSGEWLAADPQEGCFLVNIGDMLAEWTGGLYRSTHHRVVHNSPGVRISVPFFFDPNWDAVISSVLPTQQAGNREGILYKDKFVEAMQYCMVKAPKQLAGSQEEEEKKGGEEGK